jgi:diaminopimelate decarboxylase
MNHFQYRDGILHAEDVPLPKIADDVGTPTYVYSRATFERHYRVVKNAMPGADSLVCYSVKACSNLAVLTMLARLGSGADVVSGGELRRALTAGIPANKIVFSGVGKLEWEIEQAVRAGILALNVESVAELALADRVAGRLGTLAPVCLRINPDVNPKTHPYIATGLKENKFGIPLGEALSTYKRAQSLANIHPVGIACHIGSQLTELEPLSEALLQILRVVDEIEGAGIQLKLLDVGGGLGIPYDQETPPHPDEYGSLLTRLLAGRSLRLVSEPGRVIAGNAGLLLTRVIRRKDNGNRRFVIVDAGMNDLLRPALYQAFHAIDPVIEPSGATDLETVDVVGPICESADRFAAQRKLAPVVAGDLLAIRSSGAYGFSMASNYNSRQRLAEVLVDGGRYAVVRNRELLENLTAGEHIPDWFR